MEILLLVLLAGVPYYLLIEKALGKYTFFVSASLLVIGLMLMLLTGIDCSQNKLCILVAILTSVFTIYKALKTTNLYKLTNYFIFINSPVYFLFSLEHFIYFTLALLITLLGTYFIGSYYEKNYGSANFYNLGGLALEAPYAGLFLRIYLINLALYPPFPNAVFLFNSMLKDKLDLIWYTVIIVFFFGNFFTAMKILTNTVFGESNKNIFYADLEPKEKLFHTVLNVALLVIGIYGLKEVLQ